MLFAPVFSFAQCLPAWGYYQPVTINNSLAQTLTNYQVKITVNTAALVSAGHMLATGDDIRFTAAGCTNVNYWIESGMNTASTVIWLKVPTLAASANTTVNMYYGNPAATAASDGDNVFLFFDDFNDGVFNTTKWETRGTPSQCSESGGILTFTGNSNWEYIRSYTTWNIPTVVETRESAVSVSAGLVLGYAGTDMRYTFREGNAGMKGTTEDPDVSSGNAWYDMNYPNVPHTQSGYHDYEVQPFMQGSNIAISSFCDLTTSNCNTNPFVMTSATGTGYYVGFSSYSNGYTELVDWIKVRQYVTAPPTSTVGSEMVNSSLLVTSLSSGMFCAGSNVTVDFTANGTYNSGNVFTAELSDAAGSFAAPTAIGTLTSSSTGAQTLAAVIPSSTAAGSGYRIRVTASNVAQTGADNGSNLTIFGLPNVVATVSSATICNGENDTLIVTGAMSYIWNTGPTSATIVVSPGTTTQYTVIGTDMNGCANTDTVDVIVNQLPNIAASAMNGTLCEGQSDSLYVSGGDTYLWSTTETTTGIEVMPIMTTTYTVTGTDVNGCVNTDSVTVVVNALPVLNISSAADTLCNTDSPTMLSATPAGGTWSGPGVAAVTFDPAQANLGMNTVVYSYTDGSTGCSAMDSLSLYVDVCTGLSSAANTTFTLFPNPNNGTFTVTSSGENVLFEIVNVNGEVVKTFRSNTTVQTVELNLAAGMYVLRNGTTAVRFVVN